MFVQGSASEQIYNGCNFAKNGDLIFVSFNYRLNGFGYLYNENNPGSSNLGLLDQIEALEWIKRNITNFGGDKDNITVMGESAGGMSLSILLGTPMAHGLINKAIVQSGGADLCFHEKKCWR